MLPTGNILHEHTQCHHQLVAAVTSLELNNEFHFVSRTVGFPESSRRRLDRRCCLRRLGVGVQEGSSPNAGPAGHRRARHRTRGR